MWGTVGTADMFIFSWLAQQQGSSSRHAVFSRGRPSGHSHIARNMLLVQPAYKSFSGGAHIDDTYAQWYMQMTSEPDHCHLGQSLFPFRCHVSPLPWLPPTGGKAHLFCSLLYLQSLGQLLVCSRCSVSLWCVRISECHPANFRQSQGETNSSPTLFPSDS